MFRTNVWGATSVKKTKRFLSGVGCVVAGVALLVASPTWAEEETEEAATAPVSAEPEDRLSGNLNLVLDSNFMSYGLDVWGTGTFDDALFHPSFDLTWDLGGGFSLYGGTWWDVNNNADTNISDSIQEIDVWVGASYVWEKLSVSLTYQEWMYASDSERIVDLGIAYDTILSPSLVIHGRVDGNGAQEEGAVFVLGVGHSFDVGPVTLDVPLNVGLVTEDYYQDGEGGFGYVSSGLGASIPLSFISEAYGSWSANAGLTYYYTDPDVIGNPDDHILTGTLGVSVAF